MARRLTPVTNFADTLPVRAGSSPWGVVSAAGVALLAALVLGSGSLRVVERPVADLLIRAALRSAPPVPSEVPDVAIVAIDPQSLRAYPEWPWPRSLYATAIRRLEAAGARAIGFDIDLSTPRDAAADAELERALRESGRVVLAGFRQLQEAPGGGTLEVASLPRPEFAAAAASVASLLVPIDPDGVVRSAPRASRIGGELRPSLAEAALARALGADARVAEGSFRIDYRRAEGIPVLSIADVLEDRFDAAAVAGRVVLVGATAAEFQDLWATPLGPARPGVWNQAVALRTLAAERAGEPVLHEASLGGGVAGAALLSLIAAGLGALAHARRLLGLAALAALVPLGALAALARFGILVDPVVPLGVIGLHWALGLEGIRVRFQGRLAERELSLGALLRVGEAAVQTHATDPLQTALALLGDVVDASGVALFRVGPDGALDTKTLAWTRTSGAPVGDHATAATALADGSVRVFEGRRPGAEPRAGGAVYTPLLAGLAPVGVLVVERASAIPLEEIQLRTIAIVGTQLALSAQNARLLASLRETFESSVEAVASAIEARDGYTELHCRRLAAFSVVMARRLGLPDAEVEAIRLGALLHDVGKIGIRDDVLLKPGRFTPEERREMQRHPEIGRRIVHSIPGIADTTVECILHHHEWWDGRGYPSGLAGAAIPLGARIVAIVDVWDALSTSRPYKAAYPQETVRSLLCKASGVQFAPELVELLLCVLDEEGEDMLALLSERPSEGARA